MIDFHAHYVPPTLLAAAGNSDSPVGYDSRNGVLVFPSGPSRPVPQPLMDLKSRGNWIEERSIELQVVSPWMEIAGDDLSEGAARTWCQMYNDAMGEDLGHFASFQALAALPMSSGQAAADELERCVTDLKFLGGAVPTQVRGGMDLDAAGLEPLFERAQDLAAPLFIHPFRVMSPDRMAQHFLHNVCGNPFEVTLAALRLYFWGVFEIWPELKLVLAHAGGTLPIVAGRAWHASNHVSGFDRRLESPSEILDSFYYDTLLHDPMALGHAIRVIGPSRFVAGTDAPFPMWLDDPVGHIRTACAYASMDDDGTMNQILELTARHLLGI